MPAETKARPEFICDACKVGGVHEHRCHGFPCPCPDCSIDCTSCGRTAPEWLTDREGWYWSSPHPSDGLPDVICPACQQKEAQAEAALGLDKPPEEATN